MKSLYGGLMTAVVLSPSLLLCSGTIQAQSTPSSAHDVAQLVDHHYNALHSLQAGFTEQYDGLGMHRAESGTLLLQKPGRMRWEYDTPKGKLFLIDGKYAWFYSPGDPQVQRLAASKLDDLRSPLRFLLGHTQLEKELSNLTLSSGNHGDQILTGVPKGQEKRIAHITLAIAADGAITAIEIEEVDGSKTRFLFSNQKNNAPAPPDAFHFDAPADIPVVDALPPV